MKKSKVIILSSLALSLIAYAAWTTVGIVRLQSRIAQLESSQRALGRYTYDFAAAYLRTNNSFGLTRTQLATLLLNEMQQDDLLQPAIYSSRSRTIGSVGLPSRKPHNLVERVTQ
jgi:hypothetical protein